MQDNDLNNSTTSFSYETVFLALRCWWKVIFPASLLMGLGTAAALWYFHKPQYTADAWLMIREDRPPVLDATVFADSKKFIQNQIEILRSPKLLGSLARKPEIVSTPELTREIDVTAALAKKLTVAPRGRSDLYVVSFTSESPEKAELIVKETVNAYLLYNEDLGMRQNEAIVKTLTERAKERYDEIKLLREDVRRMSVDLTGIDPYGRDEKSKEASRGQTLLAELQSEIVQTKIDQDILAAKLSAKQEQLNSIGEPGPSVVAAEMATQASYQMQQGKIELFEKQEQDYSRTGRNLANNPAYRQLQSALDHEKRAFEKLKTDLEQDIKQALVTRLCAAAEADVQNLRDQAEESEIRLKVLNENLKQEIGTLKQYTGETLDLEFKRAKLAQVSAIHEMIQSRMLTVSTEQKAPERVTLFKEASRPVRPDELLPWKKIGVGTGLALVFPLMMCVAWEHFFRRVGSRSQVEQGKQLAVVGEVTALPTRSRRSSGARAAEREVMLFEESVDSLRTFLSLMDDARSTCVIAITSAIGSEGKTSLAAQLAVCIARATKQPTLLIDGDLRAPDIHNIFELELGPGLAEVLQEDSTTDEAIVTSFSDRLHILPAGRLKTNPHRLMGGDGFEALLTSLRPRYRHIIVDTPPVLPASESLVIARAADAAILCVRRDFSRLNQSQAAHARMTSAGVRVVGAVINGIPVRQYAYQYGTYAYVGSTRV
jgi:succinoglycan biosynthesis transport protein ExoP